MSQVCFLLVGNVPIGRIKHANSMRLACHPRGCYDSQADGNQDVQALQETLALREPQDSAVPQVAPRNLTVPLASYIYKAINLFTMSSYNCSLSMWYLFL